MKLRNSIIVGSLIAMTAMAGPASAGFMTFWVYGGIDNLAVIQTETTGGSACFATGEQTFECIIDYDVGTFGDAVNVRIADPGGLDDDETVNLGGGQLDGGRSANHLANGGDYRLDLPLGEFEERIVIEDASGQAVGSFYCTDVDNDNLCGDMAKGEIGQTFCGETTIWVPVNTADLFSAIYYTDGPAFHAQDCPLTSESHVGATSGRIHVYLQPWT